MPWPRPTGALLASVVVAMTLAATGCTPDVTRGRVEHDVADTFANQYAQSQRVQGKPVRPARIRSVVCHSSVNMKVDSGPGGWPCEIKYLGADGRPADDMFLALVDQLGCYQAFKQDDTKRYGMVRDVRSGRQVTDPAGSFDGCFDVYDERVNTSKR